MHVAPVPLTCSALHAHSQSSHSLVVHPSGLLVVQHIVLYGKLAARAHGTAMDWRQRYAGALASLRVSRVALRGRTCRQGAPPESAGLLSRGHGSEAQSTCIMSSCDGSARMMQRDGVRGLHPHPQVGDPGDLEEALDGRKELCGGAPAALRGGCRGDLPGVVQHAVLAVDLRTRQPMVSGPAVI